MLTGVTLAEWNATSRGSYSECFMTELNKNPGQRDELHVVHTENYDPIAWTVPSIKRLTPAVSEVGADTEEKELITIVTYTINTTAAYLSGATMVLVPPEVELRDEYKKDYRFKLVDDFGYKVTQRAVFGANKVDIYTLDPHDQIILRKHFTPASEEAGMRERMGLDTVCKDLVTHSPATKLQYKQQFPYSFYPGKAFPVNKLDSTISMYHTYEMQLDMRYLINLFKYNPSTCSWELVPGEVDRSLFKKLGKVPTPSLFLRFSDMSPIQMEAMLMNENKPFYIYNMVNCDAPGRHKPDDDVTASIKGFDGLVQVLFWALENCTHHSSNVTCNYVSDTVPTKKSQTAIAYNTLKTTTGSKFEALDSGLLDGELSFGVLPNAGTRDGILSYSYVERVGPGNNGGCNAQGVATDLTCKISSRSQDRARYRLIVRALVIKRMTINGGRISIDA